MRRDVYYTIKQEMKELKNRFMLLGTYSKKIILKLKNTGTDAILD